MRKPPASATIAAVIGIAILCGLGSWQVRRLHWKTDLLAKLEHAYNDRNPALRTMAALKNVSTGPNDFTAARLRGHFIAGQEIQIGPRGWQEDTGYYVLAPFALEGGGGIIVDRGWVPAAQRNPATRPASLPGAGPLTITGVLHAPERANPFVPANEPEKGLWYRWDVPAMARALTLSGDVAPVVLYEEEEPGANALPVRAALHWTLPNSHLYYACFWFGMAGILAIIFFMRFVRNARN